MCTDHLARDYSNILGIDPALGRDEALLVQSVAGQPRQVVRIRNIDASAVPDFRPIVRDHDEAMAALIVDQPWTRYDGGVDEVGNCQNRRCSRYGTRHPGIPCDTRRARR